MPTFPLPTLAPTVAATGITAPPYSDILQSLQATFKSIYGSDGYIDPDSQDGQLLAVFARAISDSNDACIDAFNSFSPATAIGGGLSSNVKINGIARAVPTNGSVTLRVVGVVGAVITNGIAADVLGNKWLLPASVTIPLAGQIDVTATAQQLGAVTAAIGTITSIVTPTLGWQTVTNTTAAAPGAPVEGDAALRRRQTYSTALPSSTVLDGIVGAVNAIAGVTQVRGYENDTNSTDANTLPPHSISIVALGGDATAIATAIMLKKTPGANSNGRKVVSVLSPAGIPNNIRFYVPSVITVTAALTIKALTGYTTAVSAAIKQALADYITSTLIGGGAAGVVEWDGGIVAVRSVAQASTFKIVSLVLSGPGGAGTPDVPLLFNQIALALTTDVTLTVT